MSVVDAVDGSSTGIAMCKFAVFMRTAREEPMTVHGTKRLPAAPQLESAFRGRADIYCAAPNRPVLTQTGLSPFSLENRNST